MSFSSWYDMLQPRYTKGFTCSSIMLPITVLLPIGSVPLKAMIWFLDVRLSYQMFILFGVKHVILSINYLLSLWWQLGHLQILSVVLSSQWWWWKTICKNRYETGIIVYQLYLFVCWFLSFFIVILSWDQPWFPTRSRNVTAVPLWFNTLEFLFLIFKLFHNYLFCGRLNAISIQKLKCCL
jgi:hypothetical protein